MKSLNDYKPIKELILPELGSLTCSGFVLIVGPNSSGKSQLLRDIVDALSGSPRAAVVASRVEINPPDHDTLISFLAADGQVRLELNKNNQEQLIPTVTDHSTGEAVPAVASIAMRSFHAQLAQREPQAKASYYGWIYHFLITALFLETRLTRLRAAKTIDFATQSPSHDLHRLFKNDIARRDLTAETERAFHKSVWPDISRGAVVSLKVSDNGTVPSAEDRHSFEKMSAYRDIESEGDGLKSYVATVISLLLGVRPVLLIDEPELCLHPPQAYTLGQFVGTRATAQSITFVATHSSQFLRGVLQQAQNPQIVRLTKNTRGFQARLVSPDILERTLRKPTVRAETILDGIFSQAVAVVEADTDRLVYQAAWDALAHTAKRGFDIHFAATSGTGGMADTAQLYSVLGIPVAIIADLDLVTNPVTCKQVLASICPDQGTVDRIIDRIAAIATRLAEIPPTISVSDWKTRMTELISKDVDWSRGDDRIVGREMADLSSELSAMRRLKHGGLSVLPPDIAEPLNQVLKELQAVGLFIVPVGELENWLANRGIQESKSKKWAWANSAADVIESSPPAEGDIWGFVRDVGDYLSRRFG